MKRLLLAVPVAAVALVVALATPASAHVTVNPGVATAGGFTALTVRVPNESDTASTTEVSITLPDELESARVQPVPGWDYEVDGKTITWSGGEIGPGEYMEFGISVGPLPEEEGTLLFPAVQTYDDGEVVRWIEEGHDSERPAPALSVVAAGEGDGEHADGAADGEDDGTDMATFFALLLGGVAVVVALAAFVRAGRRIPQ
jgi:uncharacterized protein YcnI